MKKNSVIFAALGLVFNSAAVFAHDGTVYIDGTIYSNSCSVDTSMPSPIPVHIGDFASGTFPSVGSTSPSPAKLEIKLTGCDEGIVGTKVTFTGTADSDNNSLLALSDTNGGGNMATGVGVEILDRNSAAIPINTESSQIALTSGDNTLTFFLRYKATKVPVTAGNASSVMYFDMSYQ